MLVMHMSVMVDGHRVEIEAAGKDRAAIQAVLQAAAQAGVEADPSPSDTELG